MAKKKGQATSAKGARAYEVSTPAGFAWLTEEELEDELVRRVEAIESGRVKTIPLDVVMRQIREKQRLRRGGH